MKLLRNVLLAGALTAGAALQAAGFTEAFADSTLRLTYSFAAAPGAPHAVYLESMEAQPGWAGRRANLGKLPLHGSGQLHVTDAATGDTIYATSFNTLFDEWLVTPEASTTPRSFSYSFLAPLPLRKAQVHVALYDKYRRKHAQAVHTYDPADILVRRIDAPQPAPHEYVHRGGDPRDVIDVAIVPEGYPADSMGLFLRDCRRVADAILGHEPFKSHADKFNFVAVMLPSADGEVSHPLRGEWHDTRYGSHYSTLYSDRYLTTPLSVRTHEDLRGIPYEHIIMLANTEQYGGGGFLNLITTAAAHHPTMRDVVTHEFGHSFGGLADEYFYPGDQMSDLYVSGIEPWERNITNLTDFTSKEWSRMLPEGVPVPTPPEQAAEFPVGLYEGGGYLEKGMYRPADKCRMRVNDYPDFCPVCVQALTELIEFYTAQPGR